MARAMITRDSLKKMLEVEDRDYVIRVIGRALVAIHNNQTASEQVANITHEHNGIGFSGTDARSGSMTAKFYIKHGKLLDWQVERWMKLDKAGYPRLCKYHKQLNTIAVAKRQKEMYDALNQVSKFTNKGE